MNPKIIIVIVIFAIFAAIAVYFLSKQASIIELSTGFKEKTGGLVDILDGLNIKLFG